MKEVLTIKDAQKSFDEINELNSVVFQGFMALAMDYGYHINNVFLTKEKAKATIYELRDNIDYRLRSSKHHLLLILRQKNEIEARFAKMLSENPKVFDGFFGGNPYFERGADEMMSIFDSVVFHVSSSFDYLAMLIQFVFGENPQTKLQWITLVKHCYSEESEFAKRAFADSIKLANGNFVSKFNDYRAELIHRKKSTAYAGVSWQLNSGEVTANFLCSDKMKSHLKKILDKDTDYCITYASLEVIKQAILNIGVVLEGVDREFRTNYHPNRPVMNNGGNQIVSLNPKTRFMESPSLGYWKKFHEYRKTVNPE